jgi:hypothetical protein
MHRRGSSVAGDVGGPGESENFGALGARLGEQFHHLLVALRLPGQRNPYDLQAEAFGPNVPSLVVGDVILLPTLPLILQRVVEQLRRLLKRHRNR